MSDGVSSAIPAFHVDEDALFPRVNVLDHVVLKKVTEAEHRHLKFFSDRVREGVFHNFPLLYDHVEICADGERVIAMEKLDGDYTRYLDQGALAESETMDDYLSMILQVFLGLYAMDSCGVYHGDLNPGNVLYKTLTEAEDASSEHPGYLKYVLGDETYYVKHMNKRWVISDFEMMGTKGDLLPPAAAYTESFLMRLFCEFYDALEKPVTGTWRYDLFAFSRFIQSFKLNARVFQQMQDRSMMNPLEALPHLLLVPYAHMLLRSL